MTPNWGDMRLPPQFWDRASPCPISGCWLLTDNIQVAKIRRQAFKALVNPAADIRRGHGGYFLWPRCESYCVNPGHAELTPYLYGKRERKERNRQHLARWRSRTPIDVRRDSHRRWKLERAYGMTVEEFCAVRDAQNNRCAICSRVFAESGWQSANVDHDHKTGKVRGLLCLNCNQGIGLFRDRPELLFAAANYLVSQHK